MKSAILDSQTDHQASELRTTATPAAKRDIKTYFANLFAAPRAQTQEVMVSSIEAGLKICSVVLDFGGLHLDCGYPALAESEAGLLEGFLRTIWHFIPKVAEPEVRQDFTAELCWLEDDLSLLKEQVERKLAAVKCLYDTEFDCQKYSATRARSAPRVRIKVGNR